MLFITFHMYIICLVDQKEHVYMHIVKYQYQGYRIKDSS